jgi:ribose transport system permease protein
LADRPTLKGKGPLGRGGQPPAGLSDPHQQIGDPAASEDVRPRRSWYELSGLSRFSALYLWAAFTVIFGLTEPAFFTSTTLTLVFGQGVVTCLVALAFLVPLAAEVYDLSVGAVMSLALCLSIYFNLHTSIPAGVGAVIAVAACAVSGAVSGFIVVRMRVNSFIATLAVSQVLLALVIWLSGNLQLVGSFSNTWSNLGNSTVKSIPIPDFYLLIIALVLWFVLEHTPAGRYLFATGGNIEAARLSGVATGRVIWLSLIASAVISGLAGILYSMRSGLFTSSVGPGYLFPAVTAVFLGASQFSQRPNVWGTLIAYFALAFGVQGLALYAPSASAWSQPLFEGVALVIAVGLAVRRSRR